MAAVVDGNEHHHKRHKCLAAPNIALQQPIHLVPAAHVGMHLADDAFLCLCQREGQVMMEEGVEGISYSSESSAHTFLLAFAGIGHDDELDEEQLLELQSHVCSSQFVSGGRVVGSPKRLIERHEVQFLYEILRQSLGQCPSEFAEECAGEVFHRTRRHASLLHAFRRGVVGLHAHLAERHGFWLVEVGMDDTQAASVNTWAAKEDIVPAKLDALLDESDSVEPCDVKEHLAVPEVACQVVLTSLSCLLETEELTQDLYERHLGGQLFYLIKAAAIDVLVREGVQQVVPGLDAQLGFQSLSPRWANAWNVGDGLLLQVFHLFKVTRRRNLDVFPIALYHKDLFAHRFNNRGIIGEGF